MEYSVVDIHSQRSLRGFIEFPHQIYRHDSLWFPPLRGELKRKLSSRTNPFLQTSEVKLFGVVRDDCSLVGRIAAIYNPDANRRDQTKVGHFGMFECVNSLPVAGLLLQSACQFVRGFGCEEIIGPVNFTTNDESGMLIEGFEKPPAVMCSYNPPYYRLLLEQSGFAKAIDLLAYEGSAFQAFPEKFRRVFERVRSDSSIRLRSFSRSNAGEDIEAIRTIYNESFKEVWGFVPLSEAEAREMGKAFLSFSDERLVWIAERDDQPVACILAVRDINEILKDVGTRLYPWGIFKILARRTSIRNIRVVVLGVVPDCRSIGIEVLLIHKIQERMQEAGYERAELSVVMENNFRMRRILESVGFVLSKRYRLFRCAVMPIAFPAVEVRT